MPAPSLSTLYEGARSYDAARFRYQAPGDQRLGRVRALFAALPGALPAGLRLPWLHTAASAAGLEIVAAQDATGPVWVVREPPGVRQGAGLFVFRRQGIALCVQALNTFEDEETGPIALDLFGAIGAACLFVDTVECPAPEIFRTATLGILEQPRWAFVQLHRCGRYTDGGDGPGEVAAVITGGVGPRSCRPAAQLRDELARRLEGPVLLCAHAADGGQSPDQTLASVARTAGVPFFQLGLSAETRNRLLAEGAGVLADSLKTALAVAPG